MRPGVTSFPLASIRCSGRSAEMLGVMAAICPYLIPMSRLPRSVWLASNTSPLVINELVLQRWVSRVEPTGRQARGSLGKQDRRLSSVGGTADHTSGGSHRP